MTNWLIPDHWQKITTVDMHVGGEPLRIVLSGAPDFIGDDVQAKFEDARKNHQAFRTKLMHEPRGHDDMYGAILLPAHQESADYRVLFMDAHDYTSMCGHGIIGLTTYLALRRNTFDEKYKVRFATPAGLIIADAKKELGRVIQVGFQGVTSYAEPKPRLFDIPQIGKITCDIAFGGELYAIIDSQQVNLHVSPSNAGKFIELGRAIKQYISTEQSLDVYGVIFVEMLGGAKSHSRNVNVFGDGSIERSPTGTGLSARLAVHARNQEIGEGDEITVASITGATFTGKLQRVHKEDFQVITPYISGTAYMTGLHTFTFDPADSLPNGFLLR